MLCMIEQILFYESSLYIHCTIRTYNTLLISLKRSLVAMCRDWTKMAWLPSLDDREFIVTLVVSLSSADDGWPVWTAFVKSLSALRVLQSTSRSSFN